MFEQTKGKNLFKLKCKIFNKCTMHNIREPSLTDSQGDFSKAKGYCPNWVYSDQMVLRMATWEAGPCERWPKTLKGELENISRKPRDWIENRHSDSLRKGQLNLFQGKMKKGDDVDDDDDDAMRTSVSHDRMTATLCMEELFPYRSPHISDR
jgi:hypothetical protein